MEIAEEALAQGDRRHAVFHVAWALATDPLRREWLAVLDRIIAGVEAPTRLAPLEKETSFAIAAVHAYILGRPGTYDRAIGILLQVFAGRPDLPYLDWAGEWLRPSGVAGTFDLTALFLGIKAVLGRFPGTVVASEADRALLEGLLPLTQRLWDLRDQLVPAPRAPRSRWLAWWGGRDRDRPDPKVHGFFLFFLTSVVRKTGRFDEALRLSEEAYRRVPGYTTAIGRAMALAALGEVDRSVAASRDSERHDPGNVSGLVDAAELLWGSRKTEEAERLYEEILRKSPDDPRALPGYCYLRYLSSDCDASWLERLRDFVDAHPDHQQARALLRGVTPYFGFLPSPSDAFVNILRQVAGPEPEPEPQTGLWTMNYRVSSLEPPSNRLAFAMLARRSGRTAQLDATIEAIPEPDPRRPLGRVAYQLWRYEETEPIPVLSPPPDDLAQAVADIAVVDNDLESWAEAAARLGASLGADRVDDLLGVMVHPPMAPDAFTPWDWVLRIQLAAALTVTGLGEGWAGSLRRKVLVSLVNGPMDWSVDATIIAMAHLASNDPEIAAEALEIFRARLRNLPDRGYTCYAIPLILAMLEQPGVTGDERAELRAKLRELS
jgi:tetratricopeptide (TPR) repeat protein